MVDLENNNAEAECLDETDTLLTSSEETGSGESVQQDDIEEDECDFFNDSDSDSDYYSDYQDEEMNNKKIQHYQLE